MRVAASLAVAILATAVSTHGKAQSMTPMRGEITSFAESFAVRVRPYNPYNHRIRVAVRVYDADFHPVAARVAPAEILLGSGASRPVIVEIDFGPRRERRVRICAESIPFPNHQTKIRAQICGRFIARRGM